MSSVLDAGEAVDDFGIYTHLFNSDDHADAIDKLGRLAGPRPSGGIVILLRG